ncbi:RGCVC family protein [Hoyosella subflava]|uniref:RGCVC family protein n=1 Tax=Hoyosella subflava TaxID=639313 RepID=UPI0011D2A651
MATVNLTGYVTSSEPTTKPPAAARPKNSGDCDMCGHPTRDHDAISLRYCLATQNGAMSRGCVCPAG